MSKSSLGNGPEGDLYLSEKTRGQISIFHAYKTEIQICNQGK
jgi:hypothetical protein